MLLNLTFGLNIDTYLVIEKLVKETNGTIAVLDHELKESYIVLENTIVISVPYARSYLKSFNEVKYHKSLYVYPLIR